MSKVELLRKLREEKFGSEVVKDVIVKVWYVCFLGEVEEKLMGKEVFKEWFKEYKNVILVMGVKVDNKKDENYIWRKGKWKKFKDESFEFLIKEMGKMCIFKKYGEYVNCRKCKYFGNCF